MAYNPGIQDRSGELLAQGISQFSGGIQQYGARKEKEQNILSEARGRGRALRSTIKGLESLNILPAGMSDDLTRAEENSSPTDFLATVNEMSDRIGGLITGGIEMNRISADKAEKQQKIDEEKRIGTIVGELYRLPNSAKSEAIAQLPPDVANRVISGMKNLAEMNKPAPEIMTEEQLIELQKKNLSFDAAPVGNGMFAVSKIGAFAKPASTTINTGENRMMADSQAALRKTKTDDINPMIASKANVEAMDALINAGVDDKGQVITGAFANLEIGAKSILNATGLANFEDVAATQEYLGSSVALVGQIIKQFGAGTGLSDADREFATSAAAGNLKYDKKALVRLVGMAKRVYKKRGELYNKDVEQTFGKPKSGEGFDPARSLYVDPTEFEFSPKSQPLGKPLSPAEKERLIELGKKR